MAIYGTAAAPPTADLPQTAAAGREREVALRQPLVAAEAALVDIRSRLTDELARARLDAAARIEAARAQLQGEQQQARAAIDQARVQIEAERVELDRRRSAMLTALDQYETQALGGISAYGRQVRAAYEQAQNPYAPGVRQLTGFAAGGVQRLPRYVIGGETGGGGAPGGGVEPFGRTADQSGSRGGPFGQVPNPSPGAGVMTWQDFDQKAVATHNPMQADQAGRKLLKDAIDREYGEGLRQIAQAEQAAYHQIMLQERQAMHDLAKAYDAAHSQAAQELAQLHAQAGRLRQRILVAAKQYPNLARFADALPQIPTTVRGKSTDELGIISPNEFMFPRAGEVVNFGSELGNPSLYEYSGNISGYGRGAPALPSGPFA